MDSPKSRSTLPIALIVGLTGLFAWLTVGRSHKAEMLPEGAQVATTVEPPRHAASNRPRDPVIGDFFVLLDVSASIRPKNEPDKHRDAVDLVRATVVALHELQEVLPIRVRVATIGDLGLDQRPACDLYLAKPTLFSPSDTAALSTALADCTAALDSLRPTRYTDIRGSLKFAAEALEGTTPRLRGILLVTDLQEDLPPGSEPAVPSLTGLCVLAYVQTNAEAAHHPVQLDARISAWTSYLTRWGARRQQVRYLAAFSGDEVQGFYRGCE